MFFVFFMLNKESHSKVWPCLLFSVIVTQKSTWHKIAVWKMFFSSLRHDIWEQSRLLPGIILIGLRKAVLFLE